MKSMKEMKEEKEFYKKIALILKEADSSLWKSVCEIDDSKYDELKISIERTMHIRGDIIVDLLIPIYKKYPEIEDEIIKPLDKETEKEMNKMIDNLFKNND